MADFSFHKKSTTDPTYRIIEEKHKKFLGEFEKYANYLTVIAGKSKGKSGKASSYKKALIRLIIGYQLNFNFSVDELSNFDTYIKLARIKDINGFADFNKSTNHFYSASLNCYRSYLVYLNEIFEKKVDDQLNQELNSSISYTENEIIYSGKILSDPKIKDDKKLVSYGETYSRSRVEAEEAKKRSNWMCEYNEKHDTFLNVNNDPYVEAHHLIPMGAQEYFKNTIDFADNIICLCPTCHQRIHRAKNNQKKEMIDSLFEERTDRIHKFGIEINKKLLLSFYQIL